MSVVVDADGAITIGGDDLVRLAALAEWAGAITAELPPDLLLWDADLEWIADEAARCYRRYGAYRDAATS